MKKSMIILAIVLVLSTVGFAFGSIANVNIQDIVSRFSDISENHWFAKTVATLVERGGIDGYTDGTFKPQREITQGEFIKTVVGSLHQELPLAKDGHWAMNYIRRAVELGYIEEGEYPEANLNNIINRYQMAKIIVNAAVAQGETFMENPSSYIERIKDYNSIPVGYKELVLKAYTQGLLGGYP
ncbi:S-layer homology domain-containing protein, partial [Alkaliphilus serpentinus]